MATTLETVCKFLDEEGLKYKAKPERNHIISGVVTENYQDSDGDHNLMIVIALEEDGEFIKVSAPEIYNYKEGPHKLALFETCLVVSWQTKMFQYEYDQSDGEIRCIVEFPLEDAELTKKQLMRVFMGLANVVDTYHSHFTSALEKGDITVGKHGHVGNMLSFLQLLKDALSGNEPDPELLERPAAQIRARKQDDGGQAGGAPSEL